MRTYEYDGDTYEYTREYNCMFCKSYTWRINRHKHICKCGLMMTIGDYPPEDWKEVPAFIRELG